MFVLLKNRSSPINVDFFLFFGEAFVQNQYFQLYKGENKVVNLLFLLWNSPWHKRNYVQAVPDQGGVYGCMCSCFVRVTGSMKNTHVLDLWRANRRTKLLLSQQLHPSKTLILKLLNFVLGMEEKSLWKSRRKSRSEIHRKGRTAVKFQEGSRNIYVELRETRVLLRLHMILSFSRNYKFYVIMFFVSILYIFKSAAFIVVLVKVVRIGYASHGNIPNRFLPNARDVRGFPESGCWKNTRFYNPVSQDHSYLGVFLILFGGVVYPLMGLCLPSNRFVIFLCGMVVSYLGYF